MLDMHILFFCQHMKIVVTMVKEIVKMLQKLYGSRDNSKII